MFTSATTGSGWWSSSSHLNILNTIYLYCGEKLLSCPICQNQFRLTPTCFSIFPCPGFSSLSYSSTVTTLPCTLKWSTFLHEGNIGYKTFESIFGQKCYYCNCTGMVVCAVMCESSKMIRNIPNLMTCLSPWYQLYHVQPTVALYVGCFVLCNGTLVCCSCPKMLPV
jgi:hypothetical protein